MSWEIICAEDEETKQLGNDEAITSLCEVIKLALLEPTEKLNVKTSPKVRSCLCYGYTCLSLGSNLFIFDENSSLIANVFLENEIDILICLPGALFLLIGDASGKIHCFHFETKQIILSKKIITEVSNDTFLYGKSFQTSDGVSVLILTSSGKIMELSSLDVEALHEGISVKDIPYLTSLKSSLSFKFHSVTLPSKVLCADFLLHGTSNLYAWLGLSDGLYVWNSKTLDTPNDVTLKCISNAYCSYVSQLFNGRYVVILDDQKQMKILCGSSGIELWDEDTEDDIQKNIVQIQQCSLDNFSAQLLLLLNKNDEFSFYILNIPSFERAAVVAVGKDPILLQLGNEADSITYLEPEYDEVDIIARFKLKCVVDGLPETRLAKLLNKHKYDEAEEFCIMFNLDVNEVLKSKSKYLCDLLNPWQTLSGNSMILNFNAISKHLEDLFLTMDRLDDHEFVTTICINAPMIDIQATCHLLTYAKKRLSMAIQGGEGDEMSSLMQQVSKNLYCLNTFCNIFPAADIHQWFSFSRSNMLEEILDHLKKGNLDIAASIWHRHQYEFLTDINDDCVSRILNAIPYEISSTILCTWLPKHLLRDLIQFCPSSIEIIAKWTDNRIKTLELVEKEAWPQNGHKLATVTIEAIEKISADFYTGGNVEVQLAVHMVNWKAHSPSSCVYHLRQTALALKDLQFLAEKFYIKVKFSEFIQEDKSAVICALLDWLVSGDEVEPLIKGFINSFVRRHELNLNEILESYVFNCLALSHYNWWMHEEAPWEDKTYAVINVITDSKIKVRCIVECVRMAPVPWSEGTQKICTIGMSLNTPYVTDLQEQEHLAKLKIILRRYNLHLINYESVYNGRFILRSIVNREGKTVLEDALTVISALKNVNIIDAYYFRILYLLNSGSYSEVKDILKQVDSEVEVKLCVKLIRYFAEHCLSIPNIKCREKLKKLYGSIPVLEPFFTKNVKMAHTDLENILEKFDRIRLLQVKYDMYPTLTEIEDDEFCINYLKNFISDLYTKCQEQPKETQNLNRTSILSGTQKRQSLAVGSLESSRVSFIKSQKTFEGVLPISEIDTTNKSEESFSKHVSSVEYLSQLLGISRERLFTLHAFIANKKGHLSEALEYTRQLSEAVGCNFSPDIVHELIKSASNYQKDNLNTKNSPKKELEEGITKLILECISLSLMYCNPSSVFVLNEYGFLYQLHNLLLEQCHFKGVYAHDRNIEPVQTLQNNPFSEVYFHCGMPLDEDIVTEKLKIVVQRASFVHSNFSSAYFSRKENVEIYGEPKPLRAVSDLVQHLQERSHDLMALFTSQNTCSNLRINNEIPSFDIGINKDKILTLLMKILNSKQKDISFAVSLLSLLDKKEAFKVVSDIIKRLGYDFPRLLLVGEIGSEYCKINKLAEIRKQLSVLVERATWGITLDRLGISFRNAFSGNKAALQEIVNNLISNHECTFVMLENFCRDFSLDKNNVLLSYLKTTLRNWHPLTENNSDTNSFLLEAPPSLVRKIEMIISKISNRDEVIAALKEELHFTSSYNYEVLGLILNFWGEFEADENNIHRGKEILHFLQTYERQCEPGDYEKSEWISLHPSLRELPSAAKFRLPFHKLFVMEKKGSKENAEKRKATFKAIIEKEINWNTVEKWVRLSYAVKLTSDQLYFLATENTLTLSLKKSINAKSQEWEVCGTNTTLLSQLQTMITKIKHPELAIACAHNIVNNLPPGADKVEAARKCVLLVNKFGCKEIKPFEKRYQQLAIEHTLHKYGLATPEYLCLKSDPESLMYALYEHSSLSPIVTLNAEHHLDINGCIKEICQIINYELESIQSALLSKWLPMKVYSFDDNGETVSNFNLNFDQDVDQKEELGLFDASLSRTIYLLRCFPQEQAISYLLDQALSPDENIGSNVKLKALRCLLAIADEETIQKHSVKSMAEFRALLQTLTYVNRLEQLGHAISQESFSNMDKNALVEGIWRGHRHNPEALLLLVDICHDYKITTASLWEAVLTQIRNFVEIGRLEIVNLEKVLMQIRNIPHLWVLSQMTSAWTYLIYFSFKKANNPISETSLWQCVHAVNLLLQSCPVDVCVQDLFSLSLSLNLPILALAISVKVENKEKEIQMILSKYSKEELKEGYKKVRSLLALPQNIEDVLAAQEKLAI